MTTRDFLQAYGPYALVIGGSYGLGAAFADALARRGLNLVLVARDEDRLRATASQLKQTYGVQVVALVADVSDYASLKAQLAGLDASVGLLVYDAAYAPIGPFDDLDDEQLLRTAKVNVEGPLLLSKFVSIPMIERGRGGIVLMSSLAGSQGSPNLAAYAATKSFNAILAEGLWHELKPHGIDVVACMAGAILTPGYQAVSNSKRAPGTLPAADVAEQTLKALGKGPIVIPGTVNKIARFVLTRVLSRRGAVSLMSKNTGSLT